MIRRSRCAHILVSAVAIAAALPSLAHAAETSSNLLINPGAETGNLSGWIVQGPGPGLPGVDDGTFGGDNLPPPAVPSTSSAASKAAVLFPRPSA